MYILLLSSQSCVRGKLREVNVKLCVDIYKVFHQDFQLLPNEVGILGGESFHLNWLREIGCILDTPTRSNAQEGIGENGIVTIHSTLKSVRQLMHEHSLPVDLRVEVEVIDIERDGLLVSLVARCRLLIGGEGTDGQTIQSTAARIS
jgi:hypothetical protein